MTYIGSTEFNLQVARGDVAGAEIASMFGFNVDLDTADGSMLVWSEGTAWIPFSAADTIDFVSTSASDGVAGTGATQITIVGIDQNRDAQTEVIATNGTTPVTTVNQWFAVNQVFVSAAGSTNWNVGSITLTENTSGNPQGFILLETSISHQLLFTVPSGQSVYMDRVLLRTSKTSGGSAPKITVKLFQSISGITREIFRGIIDASIDPVIDQTFTNPFKVEAGDYWWIEAETDTNNTFIRGAVEQKLIDN